MPKIDHAGEALFDQLLPKDPLVSRRKMFGQWAGFGNGYMFLCLFGDRLSVRLPEDQAAELMATEGAAQFAPMENRPMKGYVLIPEAWHDDLELARPWVERSLAYVMAMPPKEKKGK